MYAPFEIDSRTFDVHNEPVLRLSSGKTREHLLFDSLVKHRMHGVEMVEIGEDESIDTDRFNDIRTLTSLFRVRMEISLMTFSCFQFLNEVSFVDGFVIQLHDGILDNNEAFYSIMFSMLEEKRDQSYCVLPEELSDDVVDRSLSFLNECGMKALALG